MAVEPALIDTLVDWLTALPPADVYLAIAALAALENLFPPVPADTAAALGGFLAARNPALNVWLVWLVTITANVASATVIYIVARRVGQGVLASRFGRRVLSEQVVAKVRTEYERHHVWGIFLSRCLPVYRAVVPAFSGIMAIPARRAIPAMAAASGLFYALVVWLAYTLGQNWEQVKALVASIGTGLGLVALAVTVLLVWLLVRRKRRHA